MALNPSSQKQVCEGPTAPSPKTRGGIQLHGRRSLCKNLSHTLNDWLTREDQIQVEQSMARSGWEKLALVENWEELLRSAQRPSLRLPGEIGDSANLATQLATSTSVPRSFEVPAQSGSFVGTLAQVKVAPTMLASFEVAWARGGGSVAGEGEAEWLACSLSHDPRRAEISRLIEVLQGRRKILPEASCLTVQGLPPSVP